MKITLTGTYAGSGGIQTHLHWLSRALLEDGHVVRLASIGSSLESEDHVRALALREAGDFDLVDSSSNPPSSFQTAKRCLAHLRSFRPDAYLACGTGWNLFLPAVLSGRCPRRIFHEVMSGEAGNWRDSRWAVRRGFHEVVAQASPVARNFQRTFAWPGAVPVLPAFPEPLEITANLPEVGEGTIPAGGVRAAFFSRLVPHKRGLWLVEQWPRLSNVLSELHLFGGGPEEAQIRGLIAAKGWSDRVFCHGRYPAGQAYVDLISSFDLTLLPTVGAEGAPLVLLESMACGVPFVSTDAGGIGDYGNPDSLITPMASDEAFLAGIEEMGQRFTEGLVNRARIRRHYFERFSFKALARQWNDYLNTEG